MKQDIVSSGDGPSSTAMNIVAKVSVCIVSITQRDSIRDQWCLTHTERAQLSDGTLSMFGLQLEDLTDNWNHREAGRSGRKRDKQDVSKFISEFQRFGVISHTVD